ncbi:universal stress protein [Tellurirhabdus rosea]|uniref:universal stress protein n=1 Tax=Tellurirhabdus rosea TaxID=2674997 RepID=UPI002253E575|nr:universal stress protein [Tellurirhabdus rosea]
MRNILFPTDLTDAAHPALDWVRLLARQFKATITVLHIYQPMVADTSLPSLNGPGVGVAASQDVVDISRQTLETFVNQLLAEGLVATGDWRTGSVEKEILDAAAEHNADLIITSRDNVSTFFDRLAGSAAMDVARDAVTPVLYVPASDDNRAARPAQVSTIAYLMQQDSTQAEASRQTSDIVEAFPDASLHFLTLEQIESQRPDLVVVMDYKRGGLFSTDPVQRLLSRSEVPVLIYHPQPKNA